MIRDNWVKSLGLDRDGSLFVDIDTGLRLYDHCLGHRIAEAIGIHPEALIRGEYRPLYGSFLTTLNEIAGIVFGALYDAGREFKDGDIVVDAGARVGTFASKIAAAVGKRGRVVAVEPEPRNFDLLRKNIELNGLNNVIPVQKMIWSDAREMSLYLSGNSAAHTAYPGDFYGSTGVAVTVPAETLDAILEGLGIDSVDFIKMDIEGAEIEALQGMSKTLRFRPELSIAAYHPVEGRLSHSVVVPKLKSLGFRVALREEIVRAKDENQ